MSYTVGIMGGTTDRDDINQMLSEAQRSEEASGANNSIPSSNHKLKHWVAQHKRLSVLALSLLLMSLVLVPVLRYAVGGLFVTRDVALSVVDDQTNQPVSNATVVIRGMSFQTSADGKVDIQNLKPGAPEAEVTKQYYESASSHVKIDLLNRTYSQTIRLKPTGRAMSLKVTNRLTGDGLANVSIEAGDVKATTDQSGAASLVVSPSLNTVEIRLTADNYNPAKVSLSVPGDLPTNTIALTPSGKLYVVSKQSGKLDVVKLNLDGSGREVAVKATGNEEVSNTQIWASADWRYVVLRARRDGPKAGLYMLDTSSDTLTDLDTAAVDFRVIGWHNDQFVYTTYDANKSEWQPKREELKVFNAENGKLSTVESTQASGTGYSDYMTQTFTNPIIAQGALIYGTQWLGANPDIQKRSATLREVSLPGLTKRDLRSDLNATLSITQPEPDKVYVQVTAQATSYYQYTNKILATVKLTAEEMFKPWPKYFASSGSEYAWEEPVDGKQRVYVADATLRNRSVALDASDLNVKGWFGSDFLLLSKSDSQLYILPAHNDKVQPQKVTDYHRLPSGTIY